MLKRFLNTQSLHYEKLFIRRIDHTIPAILESVMKTNVFFMLISNEILKPVMQQMFFFMLISNEIRENWKISHAKITYITQL